MPSLVARALAPFRKAKGESTPAPAIVSPGTGFISAQNGSTPPAPAINFQALYYAVQKHSDTNACFNVLMKEVGKAGYDYASTDKDEEEPDPDMVALAEQVFQGIDGNQSFRRIVRTIVMHTNAVGNDFWVILRSKLGGQPIGLAHLHPKTARVVVDAYGTVKAYLQISPAAGQKGIQVFPPEDVLHFTYMTNPEDDVYGMGPLASLIASELEADQKAAEMNRRILTNDMKVPTIITLADDIGAADFDRIAEVLRSQYSGFQNAGKPLIASGIKDIKPMAQTFQDMQFLELRRLSTEKVCATLGVPKSVIGYRDSANEASSGKVDRITLYQTTIRPQEEDIAEKLTRDLFPKIGVEGIKFEFNYSSSVEEQLMEESTRADLERGVRTINELRYERGLEPFDVALYPLVNEPMIWTAAGPIPVKDMALGLQPSAAPVAPMDVTNDKSVLGFLRELEQRYP